MRLFGASAGPRFGYFRAPGRACRSWLRPPHSWLAAFWRPRDQSSTWRYLRDRARSSPRRSPQRSSDMGACRATEMPPLLVASAVAITTLLNPGLDGAVALSSYADCGTMVAVGALGLLGVEILARVSAADAADVRGLAWRFGFVGAMLVNLKQSNPVLLALVTVGLILVALRDPAIRPRRVLAQLPRILGPAIFLCARWRWYASQNSPDWRQAFRPCDAWS